MAAGGPDVLEVVGLLLVQLAEHLLEQDVREPDDRVQRCPQLVRHVREELALVTVRDLELRGLLLDLLEQADVLDGDGALAGERLDELDLALIERPHLDADEDDHAE